MNADVTGEPPRIDDEAAALPALPALPALEALLDDVRAERAGAREALFTATYGELRRLARARLRDGGRGTVLDTTALVHESYLRFAKAGALQAASRRAYFAYASQVMRSVIVDTVRERLTERRGGDLVRLTLSTHLQDALSADGDDDEALRVHEALDAMAAAEPRLAQVVEMRYFGGFDEAEIADTLGLTTRTVRRDWDKARRLLSAMLRL
ncbi:MAG: sigma-70 family RNA polymerase sigma factor [Burkholderiales bacterium]|nr:sigma-70 family RNA polymerase sigma factor [Burkholderiales bacterium]